MTYQITGEKVLDESSDEEEETDFGLPEGLARALKEAHSEGSKALYGTSAKPADSDSSDFDFDEYMKENKALQIKRVKEAKTWVETQKTSNNLDYILENEEGCLDDLVAHANQKKAKLAKLEGKIEAKKAAIEDENNLETRSKLETELANLEAKKKQGEESLARSEFRVKNAKINLDNLRDLKKNVIASIEKVGIDAEAHKIEAELKGLLEETEDNKQMSVEKVAKLCEDIEKYLKIIAELEKHKAEQKKEIIRLLTRSQEREKANRNSTKKSAKFPQLKRINTHYRSDSGTSDFSDFYSDYYSETPSPKEKDSQEMLVENETLKKLLEREREVLAEAQKKITGLEEQLEELKKAAKNQIEKLTKEIKALKEELDLADKKGKGLEETIEAQREQINKASSLTPAEQEFLKRIPSLIKEYYLYALPKNKNNLERQYQAHSDTSSNNSLNQIVAQNPSISLPLPNKEMKPAKEVKSELAELKNNLTKIETEHNLYKKKSEAITTNQDKLIGKLKLDLENKTSEVTRLRNRLENSELKQTKLELEVNELEKRANITSFEYNELVANKKPADLPDN
nr:13783_t:CDS:2 [Entrophospora candida]